MDTAGKVALVTGAAAGLGRELAVGLARSGADVVVADIDRAGGEETAELVRAAGRRCIPVVVDVCDGQQAEALVAGVATGGGPHILINNAGGWGRGEHQYPRSPVHEWSAALDLNLRAPMVLTQLCLGPMRAAGSGTTGTARRSTAPARRG
jgi:3-oxoacyl-[acyl-carrier protein] reductase